MNILSRKIQQTNKQTKPNKDMKIDTTCLFNFFSLSFFLLSYFLPSVSFSLLDLKHLLHCCCNFSMRTCWHSWVTTRIVRKEHLRKARLITAACSESWQEQALRAARELLFWSQLFSCEKEKGHFPERCPQPRFEPECRLQTAVQRHVHWRFVSAQNSPLHTFCDPLTKVGVLTS